MHVQVLNEHKAKTLKEEPAMSRIQPPSRHRESRLLALWCGVVKHRFEVPVVTRLGFLMYECSRCHNLEPVE